MSAVTYVPNDFDELRVRDLRLMDEEFVANPRSLAEMIAPIQAAQCILGHQNPMIDPILQNDRCLKAEVFSMRSCDQEVEECDYEACEVQGEPSVGITKDTYQLNDCIKVSFAVHEQMCTTLVPWERVEARERMIKKLALEKELAKRLPAYLATMADIIDLDQYSFDATYEANGNCISIPTPEFTTSIFSEFDYLNEQCDINNPLYIHGKNFSQERFISSLGSQACCGNIDSAVLGSNMFNHCFDSRNMREGLGTDGDRYTLVMDQNSIVFWSGYHHQTLTPQMHTKDLYTWRETLPRLMYRANGQMNPIWIDVTAEKKCIVKDGVRLWAWCYEYRLRFALNPGLCDCDGKRGIIKYLNNCVNC